MKYHGYHNNDVNFVNSHSKGVSVEKFDGGYLFKFSDGTTSLSRLGTTDISFSVEECRANGIQTCIIQLSVGKDNDASAEKLAKNCIIFGYDGKILAGDESKAFIMFQVYPICRSFAKFAKSDYAILCKMNLNTKEKFYDIYSGKGEYICSSKSFYPTMILSDLSDLSTDTYIPIARINENKIINLISKKVIIEGPDDNCGDVHCIYDENKQTQPYILFNVGYSPNRLREKKYSIICDMSGNVILDGLPPRNELIHLEDQYGTTDSLMGLSNTGKLRSIFVFGKNGNFTPSKLNDVLDLPFNGVLLEDGLNRDYLKHGLLSISLDKTFNFITSKETLLLDEWVRLNRSSVTTIGTLPSELNLILLEYPGSSKNLKLNIINPHLEEPGKLYEFEFDEPFFARVMEDPILHLEMTFLKYKGKENFFITHSRILHREKFNDLLCLDHWVDGIFIGKIDATSNDSALFVKDNGKLFFLNTPKILYDCKYKPQNKRAENTYLYDCESVEYSKFLTHCPKSYNGNPDDRFGHIFIYDKNKITILSVVHAIDMGYFDYYERTVDNVFDTNTYFPIIEKNGKYAYLKSGYVKDLPTYIRDEDVLVTYEGEGEFFDDAQSAYYANGKWHFPVTMNGENLILDSWGFPED